MKQRVLVLGADTFQLGLVRSLKAKGFETHVVSNRPHDPGVSEAHYFHAINYAACDKVLNIFKTTNAVQVFTAASDAAIICQAYIQNILGLHGHTPELIANFTGKHIYKDQLSKVAGAYVPAHAVCSNKAALLQFFLRFPNDGVVVKPCQGSGSRDVIHLKTEQEVHDYQWQGLPQQYLVEEYIAGRETGGDFLCHNGNIVFYWPTLKKNNRFHVPVSHLLLQHNGQREMILPLIQQVTEGLALPDGIYNIDVILNGPKPFLVDISPRIGGNCIPDLVNLSTGVNEWDFMTEILQGRTPVVNPVWKCPHGVFIVGSEKEGIVGNLVTTEHPFREQVTEVFWKVQPGGAVAPFTQGGNHLGYILYKASSDEELLQLQDRIESFQWFVLQ